MLTAKQEAAKKRAKPGTSKVAAETRHALFIEAIIANGGNATDAAIQAGYSPGASARVQGSRLLTDPNIAAQVAARRASLIQTMELTTERTLREIARLAYVDPRKFFHPDGRPKGITELDDDTAAALAGMEVTEEWAGQGEDRKIVGVTKKYKLADKNAALEKAMKHLGQYKKDNTQTGQAAANAIGALLKSMQKSSLPVVTDPE